MSYAREGKFCGFVWFVIPKIMINQKYRIHKSKLMMKNEGKEEVAYEELEEEVI
jgi:hypothetical protein